VRISRDEFTLVTVRTTRNPARITGLNVCVTTVQPESTGTARPTPSPSAAAPGIQLVSEIVFDHGRNAADGKITVSVRYSS